MKHIIKLLNELNEGERKDGDDVTPWAFKNGVVDVNDCYITDVYGAHYRVLSLDGEIIFSSAEAAVNYALE